MVGLEIKLDEVKRKKGSLEKSLTSKVTFRYTKQTRNIYLFFNTVISRFKSKCTKTTKNAAKIFLLK